MNNKPLMRRIILTLAFWGPMDYRSIRSALEKRVWFASEAAILLACRAAEKAGYLLPATGFDAPAWKVSVEDRTWQFANEADE